MVGEWREVRFGEVAEILPGKYIPASDYDPAGAYVVYGSNSIMGRVHIPLYEGPIIAFARIGSNCGATMYSAAPCWINNNAAGIRAKAGCDTRFIYYWMQSCDFSQIREGSGQPYISDRALKELVLLLPPLPEQRAIAHILGTLDDKIELNRRMSETLEAMARALFKAWFVDFEPVRAKMEGRWQRGQSLSGLPAHLYDLFPDRLVESELGEIPEGWEVKSLDEIAHFLNGLALQKYPPKEGRSLPVIKIAQLRSGNTLGADQASADLDPDYVVADGDILFSWSGSLECVVWAGGPGALNQHLFKVTPKRYPRWLCYFGVHAHLEEFRHIAAGKATTMGHIQRHHLSEAKLAVPPYPLLEVMDRCVSPIFEASWKRHLESRTLAALRDALLPKLIRGEIRVKDAERFLKERGL
jgi:type I restriction enzyme S subunit